MRRILLIEDDAVFRDHVAQAMQRAGFEVTCAADGEAGWAALEVSNPNLILLDLILSAHSDKAADAVMNGAQGYLIKSRFTMTGLLETVRLLTAR